MGLSAPFSSGEARELVPASGYLGVIVGVYDIGTQDGGQFGAKRQIVVTWELHNKKGVVRDKAGNPLTISKFYTLSFNEKATLRKDVEAMTGRAFSDAEASRGFDVEKLLGTACRLRVVHYSKTSGQTGDKIGTLMPLDEDDPKPEAVSDETYFEIDSASAEKREVPDFVPKWIANKVRQSKEYGGSNGQPQGNPMTVPSAVPTGDDIPF